MKSEKINIPSSEKYSANISAEKEKDTEETSLNSTKVNSPSVEIYVAMTHDTGADSTEKEPLSKSKIDETELTVSEVQTNWNLRKSMHHLQKMILLFFL